MMKKVLIVSFCVLVFSVSLAAFIKWISTSKNIVSEPRSCYDVIIVGGGSAGCVVARRLWERTNLSVLVIEAGDTAPWFSGIPLLAPALQGHSADWAYRTVPQKHSQRGLKEQQSAWPRGKVLGGSSAINYMVHMWGSRSDFDGLWSPESADWDYDSVRRYFQKSERFRGRAGKSEPDRRGTHGPMPVEEVEPSSSPLAQAFLEGASLLGIKIGDLNGELEDGAMLSQSNIKNGWRYSTLNAYLDPILENSNIHLLTNSLVIKIIIENRRATGVIAVHPHTRATYRIEATQEVVLSAGVVGSAQTLMLSGVGPQRHLERHEIPVVLDLPAVGQGLKDHLNIPLYFHLDAPVSTTSSKVRSLSSVWKYITKGKGPMAHSGVESVVRIPVPGQNPKHEKLLFMLFNLGSVNEALFTKISNYNKDAFRASFPDSKNDSKEGFIILASCTQPKSQGWIRLATPNPFEAPLIDPNYLSRAEDVRCFLKAMKMAARLGSTKPLRELGARLHLPSFDNCSEFNQSLEDDGYLECWLRTAAITAYHPVGTCAFGTSQKAVLDNRLRVKGLNNLRVIDSSAFPSLTSGNPHAVVLMVAEKATDHLLEDLKLRRLRNIHRHNGITL